MKKVLLADNEDGVLALLAAALGNDDRYSLLVARDGEEALALAKKEVPDLVVLDVMMPKVDGYQVCQALKQSPPTRHIKIVMLTAMAQYANRERARAVGADDYVTKPFSPTALRTRVRSLLALG
ncbi:MAG: response regulator [Chloroflexi bacterium]|nr:response regulator [Chloroflexota bacterium]MBI4198800.1 response regulator [Chloroflexota bacterium]